MIQEWRQAISELFSLGYLITASGTNIFYKWNRKGEPPKERVRPLIQMLKNCKTQILSDPYFFIAQTLKGINGIWQPGFLNYLKFSRPRTWERLLQLETGINECVFKNDLSGLIETLKEYKNLIAEAWRQFEPTGKQRELSFQEGACKEEETWIKKTSVM